MSSRKTMVFLALLVLAASLFPAAPAWARPPEGDGDDGEEMGGLEALLRLAGIWIANLGIGLLKAITSVFWFLEKLAAAFSGLFMEEGLWQTLREGILGTLREVMPGALRELILGDTGLLYVALMLAGVLMTIPLLGESRPVQAWRVVVWGMIVIALFISGAFGYDLIGFFEELRVWAMRTVVEAVGDNVGLSTLVARPMRATGEEVNDLSFALPADFVLVYFPEPDEEEVEVVIFEDIELGYLGTIPGLSATLRMETEESLVLRRTMAGVGVSISALTLVPGYVVLLFGIVFAALAAASLLLVIFFVAALPLGFFEFGATILSGIGQQYVYLFALSLMAAVMAGLLAAVGAQAFPEGEVLDVAGMVAYLPTLVIVGMMMQNGVKMAWSALTGTFGLLQRAVTSVGTMAYVGAPAVKGASPLGAAAKLAAGVGLAAATGGASAALMAGAGGLLSGTRAGSAAARVASAVGAGKKGHVFAMAARARGVADMAAGVVATSVRYQRLERRQAAAARARGEQAFRTEVRRESRQLNPRWKAVAVDAGAFLTADLSALGQAEQAFFKRGEQRRARQYLERTFGSREVADEVMSVYQRGGKRGAARVRQVVETTQAAALQMAAAGRPVFDEHGETTLVFHRTVRSRLVRAGLLNEQDEQDTAFVGRLAGAVVRKPVGVWVDPEAPRKLAHDTLRPEATEVAAGDLAAQYRLRDLAQRMNWGEEHLEALFEAVRDGRLAALQSKRSVEEEVFDAVRRTPETFNPTGLNSPADMRDAARLAVMVTEGAQVQRRSKVPMEPQAVPLATVTFDEEVYRRAVDAYYTCSDEAGAREMLVEATGSVDAAERLVEAFGRYSRPEAEALPRYVYGVGEYGRKRKPSFNARGVLSSEYKREAVEWTATRLGPSGTTPAASGAARLFDEVADDLLYRFDERWAERAEELAEAVLRGDGGQRAQALRQEARQQEWSRDELSALMRRAVQEAGGGMQGTGSKGQEAATLALARDAMREVERV